MQRSLFLILFFFCSSLFANSFFVVNGEVSTAKSIHAKHVVMLTYLGNCSGTIIAENAILTAAHCKESFGKINFGIDGESRDAVAVIIHEDYSTKDVSSTDLAVVFFEGGLPDGFEPMAMATNFDAIEDQDDVFVAGFGKDENRDSGTLKHFRSIISAELLDKGMLIVKNNSDGSACFGDSGGTTYIVDKNGEALLVGVNSFIGPKNDEAFCQTIYLNSVYVPLYVDWVEDQLVKYAEYLKKNN